MKSSKKRIHIYIEEDIYKKLIAKAKTNFQSISNYLSMLITKDTKEEKQS